MWRKGQRVRVHGCQYFYRLLEHHNIKMSTELGAQTGLLPHLIPEGAHVVSVNVSGRLNSEDSLQSKKSGWKISGVWAKAFFTCLNMRRFFAITKSKQATGAHRCLRRWRGTPVVLGLNLCLDFWGTFHTSKGEVGKHANKYTCTWKHGPTRIFPLQWASPCVWTFVQKY